MFMRLWKKRCWECGWLGGINAAATRWDNQRAPNASRFSKELSSVEWWKHATDMVLRLHFPSQGCLSLLGLKHWPLWGFCQLFFSSKRNSQPSGFHLQRGNGLNRNAWSEIEHRRHTFSGKGMKMLFSVGDYILLQSPELCWMLAHFLPGPAPGLRVLNNMAESATVLDDLMTHWGSWQYARKQRITK